LIVAISLHDDDALQVNEANTNNTVPKPSKSISKSWSDRSRAEEEELIDSDWDLVFPDADANNDHIYNSFGSFSS
jgi:hypothetical protein